MVEQLVSSGQHSQVFSAQELAQIRDILHSMLGQVKASFFPVCLRRCFRGVLQVVP